MNLECATKCLAGQVATVRAALGHPMVIEAVDFEYLSSMAAYTEIVLQHADVFTRLTTANGQYFFAAASAARSAFEAAVMAAWIRMPSEKVRKEGRWLGIQEGMKKAHRNYARELGEIDPSLDESAAPIRELHELLKNRSIGGQSIPVETKPNAEAMLRDIGFSGMYTAYRELCEIVHVGPEMVLRYKDGSDKDENSKIVIRPRMFTTDWVIPFLTIGWSVSTSSMATLVEIGTDSATLRKIHDSQVVLDAEVRA